MTELIEGKKDPIFITKAYSISQRLHVQFLTVSIGSVSLTNTFPEFWFFNSSYALSYDAFLPLLSFWINKKFYSYQFAYRKLETEVKP